MSLRRLWTGRSVMTALVVLSSSTLVTVAPASRPAVAPNIQGTYKATLKGHLRGKGTVLVTPVAVVILGQIAEERTGKKGALISPTLGMKDGHFSGPGLAVNSPVKIIGRVEPADGKLIRAERVFITIADASGNVSRLIAYK